MVETTVHIPQAMGEIKRKKKNKILAWKTLTLITRQVKRKVASNSLQFSTYWIIRKLRKINNWM